MDLEPACFHWVIICIQLPCVSQNWQKLKQHLIPLLHPRNPPPKVERERALHQSSGPDTAEQSEEQTSLALKDPHHQSDLPVIYGAPQWAATSRVGLFAGADFQPQPDGTLRCPTNHPLYPQERRVEQDGQRSVPSGCGWKSAPAKRPTRSEEHT